MARVRKFVPQEDTELFTTGFGWITPSGRLIGSQSNRHFEKIVTDEEAWKLVPGIATAWGSVEAAEAECQELEDRGEHGEWHEYERAQDDFTWEYYTKLLKAGFIRVGTSSYDRAVEFEGTPEALKNHLPRISRVVKEYNAEHGTKYTMRTLPKER